MFDGLNDEDDFFTPVPSSNLASLFGVTMTQGTIATNTSLTYTAPKQPSSKNDEALKNPKSKQQSTVLVFKEVHAFKLIERNYLNQGKCGLALIGNDTLRIYQLLLYKQKNDIISSSKISSQFEFIVQKDNYATFSDDQKHNWTVHFTASEELNEFSSVLESRDAKVVKTNDIASPRTILKDSIFDKESQQTDNDVQSEISSSTAKASILSRMAKMGQKLLPNSSVSDGTDSDTEKEKSLHKSRKSKRETIPTSPLSPTYTSAEISKLPPHLIANQMNAISTQNPTYIQPVTQFAMINGQPVPLATSQICHDKNLHSILPVENHSSPVMYSQMIPPSYEHLQMYFTENRTHNSEVRMNILRLTNKMEEVSEKLKKFEINTNENKDSLLKDENEKLKSIIKKLENDIEVSQEAERNKYKQFIEKEQVLSSENEVLKKSIELFVANENDYKQKIKDLEMKLKEYDETPSKPDIKDQYILVDKKKFENIEECIKKIMNALYHEINENIQDDESTSGRDVKKMVAQKIIDNTYNIITIVSDLSLNKSTHST